MPTFVIGDATAKATTFACDAGEMAVLGILASLGATTPTGDAGEMSAFPSLATANTPYAGKMAVLDGFATADAPEVLVVL